MKGIDANTTLLGAITVGLYVFIGKVLWETFARVWREKRANGDPPARSTPQAAPLPEGLEGVPGKVDALGSKVESVKRDTSTLKDRDRERGDTLGKICDSNARQEAQMMTQTGHLETMVDLQKQLVKETKRQNEGG